MITYIIVNENNQIIYENTNYLDTVNKFQEIKRTNNQYITIKTNKSFLNRF